MIHMSYDNAWVLGSALVAVVTCYVAISLEQLISNIKSSTYKKIILGISGLVLGFSIWAMHFIAMLACHLPQGYSFNTSLTFISYVIAAISSTFVIWLTTRASFPITRLISGSILMGIGIAGMHYTGMMGIVLPHHLVEYNLILVILSVVIAVAGSGLSFWLIFKFKQNAYSKPIFRVIVSCMIALSIVGMHYTGMAAATFQHIESHLVSWEAYKHSENLELFILVFIACLVLLAVFSVAILELRLEEQNLQLLRANKELETLALQDNLTKLPNRLFLLDYTNSLFKEHTSKNNKIAFIYIDLDRFKAVNDAFGHQLGDELLVQLAQRLYATLELDQKLVRIGGDEFLLILENFSPEHLDSVADLILSKIQESFMIESKEINISASLGVVYFPDHGNNLQDLLINADAAMMMSKEQGRNTFSVFNYSLDQQENARSKSKLINDLYKAVEEQQFVLFYQPKFTTDFEICGVEALIRWKHPALGLLAPNMFIEGAEQTGLIIKMGYWALEQACMQIRDWSDKNKAFCPIAVNLSAVQFEHKHLIETLKSLIDKYQIQPQCLIIEITESTAMHHIDVSIRTFEKLRQLGIRLAIDDFGTGHSSFLYLKDLPVDELKIDREFIRNLAPGSKEEIILQSIIQLSNRLGLTVTAEGVETQNQADILKRLGCQQLQGYLLGMPLPVDRLESTFNSENYNFQAHKFKENHSED
ncbi:EAL domain-containing protein [Acinetobacter shaoyimingii]|uniref:EAL domain-containing protein n=1 Tax=Acinetobacter shaoyimingii TaxID=2715164 RepID=A0A6G8RSX7_9GAMM|nr:EAL domain-containing protein [Acinetobacter shaoyimingii]NHB56498.1 EAL domain-containing protein [Acinetobacter shaoyimingii]QIO04995.1 EAL domain-containing protein [Acinetobacter shaoyimingii]